MTKKTNIFFIIFSFLNLILFEKKSLSKDLREIKVLHLSFHSGCISDFEFVANKLGINLTSLNVPSIPRREWDEKSPGASIYNIGHDRAKRIWDKKKEYFDQFDIILTSDIAPLSRIFLQNGWDKPLIVWICNRFDYYDGATNDCGFPDNEYYNLIKNSLKNHKVKVIPNASFEILYASTKNINLTESVIKPIGAILFEKIESSIPHNINKSNKFYIPPYIINTEFVKTEQNCKNAGINVYCGRYGSKKELSEFKGIIHMPYQWSNFAFFQDIYTGLVHFVPSQNFIRNLMHGSYWHANANFMHDPNNFKYSEWYSQDNEAAIIYFDSWQDLKNKTETISFESLKPKIKQFAQDHQTKTLIQWKNVFDELSQYCN